MEGCYIGDRGCIHITRTNKYEEDGKEKSNAEHVWLYTHWGAYKLPQTLARALARRERWSDIGYLARIIFCTMVKGREDAETGYGIYGSGDAHCPIGDAWRVIHIDVNEQKVTIEDNGRPLGCHFDFAEFVDKFIDNNDE